MHTIGSVIKRITKYFCLFFFLGFFFSQAVSPERLFSKDVSFSFKRKGRESSLLLALRTDEARYNVKTTIDEDGGFSLKAPPFFSLFTKSGIVIGELKMSSYPYFALHPLSTNVFNLHKQKVVSEDKEPGTSGEFSGVAKNFTLKKSSQNITVGVFTPLLNVLSPSGFVLSFSSPDFFASLINLSSNNITRKRLSTGYQKDWRSLKLYSQRYYLLAGFKNDVPVGSSRLKTFVFSESVFDSALGFWGVVGWNVNYNVNDFEINAYRRINSKGAMNEALSSGGFSLSVKKNASLSVSYEDELYPAPVYGGSSQEREISYSVRAEFLRALFIAKHTYRIEKNTGHTEKSEYTLSLGRFKIRDNFVNFRADVAFTRIEKRNLLLKKLSFVLQDKRAKLEISGEKVLLEFTYEANVNKMRLRASVNQDRTVTLSGKYEY